MYPPERPKDVQRKFRVRNTGPRHTEGCLTPIQFFSLFMTQTIWNLMVQETNRHAHNIISAANAGVGLIHLKFRMRSWVDVSLAEMKIFWGILLNMGLTKRKLAPHYWSTLPAAHSPFFSRTMPLRRFQQIMSAFHLSSLYLRLGANLGMTHG